MPRAAPTMRQRRRPTSAAILSLATLLVATLIQPASAINGRPASVDGSADTTTHPNCRLNSIRDASYTLSLHVTAIFIVFVSSTVGITLPFAAKLSKKTSTDGNHAPTKWDHVFFISKYSGAGVILATAFVHLTYEAFVQLASPCLTLAYPPMAPAISMASMLLIFVVDFLLMRHIHLSRKAMEGLKASRAKSKTQIDSLTLNSIRPTDSVMTVEGLRGDEIQAAATPVSKSDEERKVDGELLQERLRKEEQIEEEERITEHKLHERAKELDVMVIEGGIVFHSIMVGLGLGTSSDAGFVPYFVAIVFHQMFDGFAIGTRMAELDFTNKRKKQLVMILAYALVTPVGIALGVSVRTKFEPNDPTTILAIGILDSLSAGVLLYGALVDLLAKEFLFGPMLEASLARLGVAGGSLVLGAAVMSLLGKWA